MQLGDSYGHALKRLLSLERNLAKNPEHRKQYNDFMKEYEDLGHMSEDKISDIHNGNFLSHHSVLKQSSLTTKLRVVFDASAKTSTGLSLNETLMVGPNIQEDRQIEINEQDRKFQKILWRANPNLPIKIFTLNTVTYGTFAASFLATPSLKQLAQHVVDIFPKASMILTEDFYMDDV